MSFLLFLLYYFICSIILGLVLLCVYRLFVRHKCRIVERTALKTIDDYFKAYDNDFPVEYDTFCRFNDLVGDDRVDDPNR